MGPEGSDRSKTLSPSPEGRDTSTHGNVTASDMVNVTTDVNNQEENDNSTASISGNNRKRERESQDANIASKAARVGENYAKWWSIRRDGTYVFDETKIKCVMSEEDRESKAVMRHIASGLALSSQVHPIIFDTAGHDAPDVVRLRSLSYFDELLADEAMARSKYEALSSWHKKIVAVGVRDLYLAVSNGLLGERERRLLDGMVRIMDGPQQKIELGGMAISFHPSASFKLVKYIEALDHKLKLDQPTLFAQMTDTPRLFAVFVNPAELSYHNFENIIPLDSWFESKLGHQHDGSLPLSLSDFVRLQAGREVFSCKLQGSSSGMLKDLSSLNLYIPPLNKGTRGGDRFIFHSTILSKALTEAVKSSGIIHGLADDRLGSSFEFVNYVFRCNRFNPGDAKFGSHLDTPYYDRARSHVSKYTLLLYLSPGQNDPVLRVQDVHLNKVEEMTYVIFDQKYEHEGRPYLDGPKIFLRTELIFKDKRLGQNHKIAELFSEACYMTGQSVFDDELASYAHECFERANSLHWAVEKEATEPPVYLFKQFEGISFMTNGYRHWFPKFGSIDARDCGLVAVLDYFNCKVDGQSFRSISSSTTIRETFTSTDDIWKLLCSHYGSQTPKLFRRLKKSDVESLIRKERDPDALFVGQMEDWDGDDEELEERFGDVKDGDGCCPMHSFPMFNPWKSKDVMEDYEKCCKYTRAKLFASPVLIFDKEVVLNELSVKLVEDKIYFLQERDGTVLPPINFAACWGDEPMPPDFIAVQEEIVAPKLLIPPITFHEYPQGYQLGLDFFRNDWMVRVDDERIIPVPAISEAYPAIPEELLFLNKVTEPNEELRKLYDYSGHSCETADSGSAEDMGTLSDGAQDCE